MSDRGSSDSAYRLISLALLVTDCSLLCGLGAGMLALSGGLEGVYADMGVALPKLTILILAVPRPAYVAAVSLLGIALIGKEVAIRHLAVRLWVNLAVLVLLVIAAAVWVAGMVIPLMQITSSLQR